jgi:hypothetical protein
VNFTTPNIRKALRLAALLDALLNDEEDARFLHRTLRYLKRQLVFLDRNAYREFAVKHVEQAKKRNRARAEAGGDGGRRPR